ncbi:Methyl-accepting chemotaxis protein, HBM sensor domain-containing [Desulfonema limicola]|uniref:Methyl-accepting chemotaxis protein, HBM sensor domain-containing n=1 Tax=Desulfonema limicola TaxID=45656 RepID=A0A975GIY3_9BACT|nr:methyl-accepting chemotaxis protein [Desulfonema limicola]QTA83037.1 Methyl-accepting chemotaxis protein, HBM sensor domain-containing [Desulfonema limicola]
MKKRYRLSYKIVFGFLIVLMLNLFAAFGSSRGLFDIKRRFENTENVNEIVQIMLEIRRHEKNFIIRHDNEYIKKVNTYLEDLNNKAYQAKTRLKDPKDIQVIENLINSASLYKESFNNYIEICRKQDKTEADKHQLTQLDMEMVQSARQVLDTCYTAGSAQKMKMQKEIKISIIILAASFISAFCFGIFFSIIISKSITKPINSVVNKLTDTSHELASASTQVAEVSLSLAQGTSEQAAAVEQTSASLEEISSMIKQNADNAKKADLFMKETYNIVEKAGKSMEDLTLSMNDILASSEETFKIIKTIDEIAFQTNLLALNAAVEAARAGNAGAGFAVVSQEVRNLAMKAADAAKNTSEMISKTVKKIRLGSGLLAATGTDFSRVSENASSVAEIISEISAASGDQAAGIGQISTAVVEMDKTIQSNAATAEHSSSASVQLNTQANEMEKFTDELMEIVLGKT